MKANWIIFLSSLLALTAIADENMVVDKLKRLDIKASVRLIDLDLFDGLNFSTKQYYQVQPSYLGDYYSRIDALDVNLKINPTDFMDNGTNEHIGLSINRNTRLTFVQQFRTQKEALRAVPKIYLLDKLPVSAEKTLKHLSVGEFVSLRANLNFAVSASVAASQGWITAKLYAYYILSGEFEIRVYRLKNNKIRLQIFADKTKDANVGFKISLKDDLEIFGVEYIDDHILRIIRLELLEVNFDKGMQNLFLVDYILKLDDSDVAEAYDDLLSSATRIKSFNRIRMLNPFVDSEEMADLLHSNFIKMEKIFLEDYNNGVDKKKRRIHRIFKGKNQSKFVGSQFQIGLNFLRYENGSVFRDTHLSRENPDGTKNYYGFPSYTLTDHYRFMFGLMGQEDEHLSMNLLFLEDEFQNPIRFLNFGAYYDLTDKVFDEYEQSAIKMTMRRNLPKFVYDSIIWGDWEEEKQRKNGRVYTEYYFHREAFEYLSRYSHEDLENLLREFIDNLPFHSGARESHRSASEEMCSDQIDRKDLGGILRQYDYTGDICFIAFHLHQAVASKGNPKARLTYFMALRNSDLFMNIGIGFLMSLLPPEDLGALVGFKMRWHADSTEGLEFDYGSRRGRELYDSILSIQDILNDRSYDMRILDDALNP